MVPIPIPRMDRRQLYTWGDSIYLLSDSASWGEAQVEAQSFQGNLVTIESAREQTLLAGLFASEEPWIGFNDAGSEGELNWINGKSAYRNWAAGGPNNSSGEDFAYIWNSSEWYLGGQADQRKGIIEIKDPSTPILIIEDLGIVEPSSGTKEAVFIIRRYGNSTNAVSVDYRTVRGTAAAKENFEAVKGTLTFAPGQLVQTISVPILKDSDNLTGKTFFLKLKGPTGGAILGDSKAKAILRDSTETLPSLGNSSYLLTNAGTWGQAQNEARIFGGNLVTVNSSDEQSLLAQNYAGNTPWIGLSDAGQEGIFTWNTGKSAFTNWGGGNPDNSAGADYAYIWSNSEWFVGGQTDSRRGIIEITNSIKLTGNAEDNILFGSDGKDTLDGGAGNDQLIGKSGNDILVGKAGNDFLIGNSGNDTLTGGVGSDVLTGGAGADGFSFGSVSEGLDQITDYSVPDDSIIVSSKGFGGGLTANSPITSDQFLIGAISTASTHRFLYDNATGSLLFDQDGSGPLAAVQIAALRTALAFTKADILVVA
jgi:Ca2+-binding RTX toxin-like protein